MATLRQGSTGDEVKKLQNALINAGYDVGSTGADGIYGSKTASAVKAYQKANGLSVDGIAGTQTFGSLYNTSSSSTNNTKAEEPKSKYNVGGVSDEQMDKAYNNTFNVSDAQKEKDAKASNQGTYIEGIVNNANKNGIISSDTWDKINSGFSASSAYYEAKRYTDQLLEKLSSGRTSYTDDVEAMMQKILNREEFEYDVDKDQLFQQALASAMNSGKTAMQDTIGQASALTGGYGSTYATSAGNQAYNAFIEDAYNNLPEYYQMAMQAYQMEGEEMYNQLGMFVDADNREYQRTYDAWNANFANTESIYNKEYGAWQDGVQNAISSANLQLNEFGTTLDANYKLYDVYRDDANTNYQREYQSWADSVSQAQSLVNTLASDWQADRSFDEGVRQFNEQMAENKRQFNETMAFNRSKQSGSPKSNNPSNITDSQLKNIQEVYIQAGGGDAGLEAVDGYLSAIGKNNLSEEATNYLIDTLNSADVPVYYQDWTISKDTYNGGFLGLPFWQGDDHNDVYTNGTTTMTYKQLKNSLKGSGLSEAEQEKFLNKLKSQSKN